MSLEARGRRGCQGRSMRCLPLLPRPCPLASHTLVPCPWRRGGWRSCPSPAEILSSEILRQYVALLDVS